MRINKQETIGHKSSLKDGWLHTQTVYLPVSSHVPIQVATGPNVDQANVLTTARILLGFTIRFE